MSGFYALAGMGAICLVALVLVYAAIRAAGRASAAEANEAATKRLIEAIQQQETIKDERLSRMADAAAASVDEPADRIRERLRKRPTNTR